MKEKITNHALRLLKKDGLKSFSMRKLAETLSIDPMTIYYYFKNKDHLMAELVDVVFHKFYEGLSLDEGTGNEKEKLETVLIEYRSFFIQYIDISLYLIQSPSHEYPAVKNLNDLILDLIQSSSPYENSELTRDILVDYIHGNALSLSNHVQKRSSLKTNQFHSDQFRKTLKRLIHRLFENRQLA